MKFGYVNNLNFAGIINDLHDVRWNTNNPFWSGHELCPAMQCPRLNAILVLGTHLEIVFYGKIRNKSNFPPGCCACWNISYATHKHEIPSKRKLFDTVDQSQQLQYQNAQLINHVAESVRRSGLESVGSIFENEQKQRMERNIENRFDELWNALKQLMNAARTRCTVCNAIWTAFFWSLSLHAAFSIIHLISCRSTHINVFHLSDCMIWRRILLFFEAIAITSGWSRITIYQDGKVFFKRIASWIDFFTSFKRLEKIPFPKKKNSDAIVWTDLIYFHGFFSLSLFGLKTVSCCC